MDFDDDFENLNNGQTSDTKKSNEQSEIEQLNLKQSQSVQSNSIVVNEHENSINENEKTIISAQSSNSSILNQQQTFSTQTKMAPPEPEAFLTMCTRHISKHFSGDPLERKAFIKSIKLLQTIAESEPNKKILGNYIHTRLIGKASECVPADSEDIDIIIKAIEDNFE